MIHLTCTSCRTVLQIDDAFAGGVCRCQHCGTIQTVPAHLKGKSTVGATAQKSLYNKGSGDSGTGLDALADVVASSGLARSGLQRRGKTAAGVAPKSSHKNKLLLIGAPLAAILVAALLLWLVVGSGSGSKTTTEQPVAPSVTTADPASTSNEPTGPHFCGLPLEERTIVYVLDRGNATRDSFGYLKEACYNSLSTLGSDRKFQVLFWSNNSGSDDRYPVSIPVYATAVNIEACRKALDEVFAFGQTDAKPALRQAMTSGANHIVLATAKGWELDDTFTKEVMEIVGPRVKISIVSIGDARSPALQALAEKTGGRYATLTEGALRRFAQ